MKKFITLFAAFVCVFTASAQIQYAIGDNTAATNIAVLSQPRVLRNITLYSTNAAPTLVRLYDGGLTVVTGAYTNYTTYPTNTIVSYVTTEGTTNNFTNTTLHTEVTLTAAATNNRTPFKTIVVPPASEVIVSDLGNYSIARSLTLSNSQDGLSYVLEYRNP